MGTVTDKEKIQMLMTHDKLLDLVISNLPVILFMADREGIIRFLAGDQVGRLPLLDANVLNRSIYEVYAGVPEAVSSIQRGLSGSSDSFHGEVNGTTFDTHISPLHDESGEILGVIGAVLDVSDQHRVEQALAESEARYKALFDRAAIGVVLKALDGRMFSFNPAFLNMLGYSSEEMAAYGYLDITHPQDQAASERLFRELVSGKRESYTLEKRYRCKDGRYRWGRMRASLLKGPTGEPQYVIGMIEDITEQKEMETELTEVQRRLLSGRELDRLQLAQELHDGPLQEIIGITYQLKALENESIAEYNLSKLHSIENTLDSLAERLRKLASQLRPPVLAPFGLEKAIRSDVEQIQREHPELQIVVRLTPDQLQLPNEMRFTLFRIYQEAMKNVLQHASAKTIWIRFLLDDEYVVLEIQDNGCGFVPPKRWVEFAREGHLGLVGAIERAEAAGGRLEIETKPEKGTLIRTVIPRNDAKP